MDGWKSQERQNHNTNKSNLFLEIPLLTSSDNDGYLLHTKQVFTHLEKKQEAESKPISDIWPHANQKMLLDLWLF